MDLLAWEAVELKEPQVLVAPAVRVVTKAQNVLGVAEPTLGAMPFDML